MKAVTCLTLTFQLLLLVLTQVEVGLNFLKQVKKGQVQAEKELGIDRFFFAIASFSSKLSMIMQEDRRSRNTPRKINALETKLSHLSRTFSKGSFCQQHSPFMQAKLLSLSNYHHNHNSIVKDMHLKGVNLS